MGRSQISPTSWLSAAKKAPDSFSNLPHSLNGGTEGAAMRLTLHCFHRKHIILRPCSDIPAPKTTSGPVKEAQTHSYTFRRAERRPGKNQNNPTSSLINMRSADTHQPKSTIFAHLLGLPCSLLPTKERNKYITNPKT